MDPIVQISSRTGFVQADNMRPITFPNKLSGWAELSIRPSVTIAPDGRSGSINLTSSANGTGTYRVEIWRNDACVTHTLLPWRLPAPRLHVMGIC
jgi:hypothetical protein